MGVRVTDERVAYRDGAFYVESCSQQEATLTDAKPGLARQITPLIAFGSKSIDELRAPWEDETIREVLLEASRIALDDFDDGVIYARHEEKDLREALINALAEAVNLKSRLTALRLGGI